MKAAPHARPLRTGPVAGLLLAAVIGGCNRDTLRHFAFDGPEWSDVLYPEEGGPFWTEIGFVANTRDGTIVPLDLRHGTVLGDQYGGPFLRPRQVATGELRQLGQISAWAEDDDTVKVFAADLHFGVLVEATYIEEVVDGEPQPPAARLSNATFRDNDESGDEAALTKVELRRGFTTTERWTLTFDGEAWTVEGSRSGRQGRSATPGERYQSDNLEVVFTVTGKASEGDQLVFSTDTGVEEHDLGGLVMGLTELEGEDQLLAAVWDPAASTGHLALFDLPTRTVVGRVRLPSGAQPWRFATDPSTGLIYVADAQLPSVWAVALDRELPEASGVDEISVPAPVHAIAFVAHEAEVGFEEPAYRHLFVAPADGDRVDVYDLDSGLWLDANPRDGVTGGVDLLSPVVGLSASPLPIRLAQTSNYGARTSDHVVTVSTFDGALRALEGATGCVVINTAGPSINYEVGVLQLSFTDKGATSNPVLSTDRATSRQVVAHPCGGVTRGETWTLTYDGTRGVWDAEGSISGLQLTPVQEDVRYVTDDGSLSFLILSGTSPSTDGDQFSFVLNDGQLRLTEAVRTLGTVATPFELPGPPLVYSFDAGPTGGGWDIDRTKVEALLPVTNTDMVVSVRLQGWSVQHVFE